MYRHLYRPSPSIFMIRSRREIAKIDDLALQYHLVLTILCRCWNTRENDAQTFQRRINFDTTKMSTINTDTLLLEEPYTGDHSPRMTCDENYSTPLDTNLICQEERKKEEWRSRGKKLRNALYKNAKERKFVLIYLAIVTTSRSHLYHQLFFVSMGKRGG